MSVEQSKSPEAQRYADVLEVDMDRVKRYMDVHKGLISPLITDAIVPTGFGIPVERQRHEHPGEDAIAEQMADIQRRARDVCDMDIWCLSRRGLLAWLRLADGEAQMQVRLQPWLKDRPRNRSEAILLAVLGHKWTLEGKLIVEATQPGTTIGDSTSGPPSGLKV